MSLILARSTKIFVAPGEHGFSFFQVKMFTGSVSVLLTSTSLKIERKNFLLNLQIWAWYKRRSGARYG